MWFVHKQVILTNDNLAKRNWTGYTRCSFCDQYESIKHLFLDCPLAKIMWRSVHITFNITPPTSINTLFGTWLDGIDTATARHIRVGVCALLWAVWNCRNDLVFNRTTNIIFCRLYSEPQRLSVCRRYSLQRRSGSVWLLGLSDER